MLFGPRITRVFHSRWNAAFWCVSILFTAYEVATGGTPDAGNIKQVAGMVDGGAAPAASPGPANPWAPAAPAARARD